MRRFTRRLYRLLARDEPDDLAVEPALVPYVERPVQPPGPAVVLWFRDGTAAALDPRDPRSGALQILASRLREPYT